MDPGALDLWLGAYKRAWEERDPEAAADLFAADATYHETPFDEPSRGRDGIFAYWSGATQMQRDVRFSYETLAATEDGGVAHWRVSFTRLPTSDRVELDGVFLIKLNADGRCAEFREWWHMREEKAS